MTRLLPCIIFILLITTACDTPQEQPATLPEAEATTVQLSRIFAEFWEEYLALNPEFATYIGDNRFNDKFSNDISPDWIARTQELEHRYLMKIQKIDPNLLQGQDRLSYDVFVYSRETSIKGFKYPEELLPVNQFFSTPPFFRDHGLRQKCAPVHNCQGL